MSKRNPQDQGYKRTTIVLPEALDRNLHIFAAQKGKTRNEIVVEALIDTLTKAGLQPLQIPKSVDIKVEYEDGAPSQ